MNYYQTSQMNRSCQNPRRSEAASRMNSCSAACRPAPRTENRSSNCRPAPRMENRSSDCRPAPRAENRSSDCQASHGTEHSSKRSLAMAYVPWQKFEDLYPNDAALSKGTLFCQLDLPFRGRR